MSRTLPEIDGRAAEYFAFARERYSIFRRREEGEPGPWTEDEILRTYRFCNIFRNDDRVTRWFHQEVLACVATNRLRLRAALIFRYLNRIETGEVVKEVLLHPGLPAASLLAHVEHELRRLVGSGQPILGPAYMIKTPLRKDKVTGLLELWRGVLAHEDSIVYQMQQERSLKFAVEQLCSYPYVGPFMAYEIVTDLRWTPLLSHAFDIHSYANPGPGAVRGAARLLGKNAEELNRASKAHLELVNDVMADLLGRSAFARFWPLDWPQWEMRDVEHTLCEFDKYERARLGEGRPKQLFRPRGD